MPGEPALDHDHQDTDSSFCKTHSFTRDDPGMPRSLACRSIFSTAHRGRVRHTRFVSMPGRRTLDQSIALPSSWPSSKRRSNSAVVIVVFIPVNLLAPVTAHGNDLEWLSCLFNVGRMKITMAGVSPDWRIGKKTNRFSITGLTRKQ